MKLECNPIKRCAIFLYYDRDGIVDKYVIELLRDIQQNVEYLLVVCNGYMQAESLSDLKNVSDEIICRANMGFDVGGYREGLFYLGWKQLQKYDELVLFNYTFFGPLYPFSEMFAVMDKKDLDFWGITKHHKVEPDPFGVLPYGYLPEHIQSHFLVLRRSLFMSYQYRDFIYNMKNPATYLDSICGYEAIFTKYFEDFGFKWEVYVDTDEYEGYSYNPHMFYTTELIEQKRCPIIKRRSFFTNYGDYLLNTCGETSSVMYKYLQEKNIYDLDLIWDNLLRLENITAIHRVLHLDYFLESFASDYTWKNKIAVIILANSDKRISWYRKYLKSIPECIDIYICGDRNVCNTVAGQVDRKCEIRPMIDENYTEQQILGVIAEEIKVCNYQYIGVARIRNIEKIPPYSNNVSWQYADWENLFGNENIIGNILRTFEENPRMGMAIPPIPCYGTLFTKIEDGWCGKFDEAREYLEKKNIDVNYSQMEPPLAPLGGSFWIRGSLLEKIADNDNCQDEKIYLLTLAFLVQHAKAYTGIIYSDRYAPIEITNQDYMLRENNKVVFKKYGPNYHKVVVERIQTGDFSSGEPD